MSSSSSSSCACSSLKCKENQYGFVEKPNLLFQLKNVTGSYNDSQISGYNNLIVYKKYREDYEPIFESKYITDKSGIAYSGFFEKDNYKVRVKKIINKSGNINLLQPNGIQILNLIDVSQSNISGINLFRNETRQTFIDVLYENFRENNNSRQVGIIQYAGPDFNITGTQFLTNHSNFIDVVNVLSGVEKPYEGVDLQKALNLAKTYPWEKNKIKIMNIISNNTSYIKQKNLTTTIACITDYYPNSSSTEIFSFNELEKEVLYFKNSGINVNFFDYSN